MSETSKQTKSWRDVLPIHPAADLFPLMSPDELKALGEDIKAHGLTSPIVFWSTKRRSGKMFLLDGRNRLDALERLGFQIVGSFGSALNIDDALGTEPGHHEWHLCGEPAASDDDSNPGYASGCDPYAFVISANIHRRHLTSEQKRDLIVKLLKATPEKSNRQIAKMVDRSHPTVAKVRDELEKTGDVERITTSIDTKGRMQPAKRPTTTKPEAANQGIPEVRASPEKRSSELPTGSPIAPKAEIEADSATSAEKRKAEYAAAVNAKDTALDEFDGHGLRLVQMTSKAKPERFAKTGVSAAHLMVLGDFLMDLAAELERRE